MSLDARWLHETLAARLPRESPRARLALTTWQGTPGYAAETTGASPLGLWACLELRPSTGGTRTGICVLVRPKAHAQPRERATAYLDGWLTAIDRVVAEAAPQVLANMVLANLVRAEVLELARPKTAADFAAQILAPKRLGKLLGDPLTAMRSLDAGRS